MFILIHVSDRDWSIALSRTALLFFPVHITTYVLELLALNTRLYFLETTYSKPYRGLSAIGVEWPAE